MFAAQIPKDYEDVQARCKVESRLKRILRTIVCGAGGALDDDAKEREDESVGSDLVFDPEKIKNLNFFEAISAPKVEIVELDEDDQKVLEQWNPNELKPSTKQMVQEIISRIDIRDMIQVNTFFDTLAEMHCDIDPATSTFEEFSKHKYADFETIPNDFNLLLTEIGCKYNMVNVLRAICAVSIVCHSNKLWKDNLSWFGDDKLKQLFNDPQSVLRYIYKEIVISDRRREYEEYLENKRMAELIEIHNNPMLPDDVDEDGNLPEFRCGWKRCGKVFDNRDRLLNHVAKFLQSPFVHRFHLHCGMVLEPTPNMEFAEFRQKVLAMTPQEKRPNIQDIHFKTYYDQFQPIFRKKKQCKIISKK